MKDTKRLPTLSRQWAHRTAIYNVMRARPGPVCPPPGPTASDRILTSVLDSVLVMGVQEEGSAEGQQDGDPHTLQKPEPSRKDRGPSFCVYVCVCVCGGVLIRINESISITSLWSLEWLITSLFFFFKCYGDRSVTASLRTWDPTPSVFNFAISQAWYQETANDITRETNRTESPVSNCVYGLALPTLLPGELSVRNKPFLRNGDGKSGHPCARINYPLI